VAVLTAFASRPLPTPSAMRTGERRHRVLGADAERRVERGALRGHRRVEADVEPGDLSQIALVDPQRAVRAGDERVGEPPGIR
jgi:hypothetical protein